ncbi:trifunctional purine biosynthetic protein adenosine-3 [Coccinella septempunctata]|uniref:trifunctional purine biosynthetic protein adenosine-3 n=1 Tax=Coccinella septempunctata TaxID=41139 RepID=UPI001D066D29|nr:trifunctional purine biosynthetic protein adenosine-3 [Coccinella septempunctata]
MSAKVVVIGSGGREHAIVWKISQSDLVKQIFVIPGSYAIAKVEKAENVAIDVNKFEDIKKFCEENSVDVVVVGPEDPLAKGIADFLGKSNIKVFGPSKDAALLESDKSWAKAFFDRHDIPTARWKSFDNAEEAKRFIMGAPFPALVVKASGLAAGKGVIVSSTRQEACGAVDAILGDKKFGSAGETVVVEELLDGEEVSVLAFTDGKTVKAMLPAQDHKRIYDNDQGPNTGGMGAYCPCHLLNDDQIKFVQKNILERTVEGFKKDRIPYVGVLYAGLMITSDGIKILEYNCRFGDPETEVILPLLESDLYSIISSCCDGTLDKSEIRWKEGLTAVGVVMASCGYPGTPKKGQEITGIEEIEKKSNYVVFHCGTSFKDGHLVTNGGRVLIVVSLAEQLAKAAAEATQACKIIKFDGCQFRKDIAVKGIARSILTSGKLSYKQCGVDITAGNDLVSHIKPKAKATNRPGVMGSIGGFGGLFDAKAAGYKDPLLVSGTDGVGTKLKIAQEVGIHDTIGIDLVAMCVNDVLAHGAEPLFFLDYFACGHLEVDVAKDVVSGVAEGCLQAGCSLIGGETAEMPDIYPDGEYDVAGFAVGAVERTHLLPRVQDIEVGDVLIGLPSSGVHSNGFSLVRRVMKLAGVTYHSLCTFSESNKTFGEELLTPTKIYVKSVVPLIKTEKIKAFAHITGGGLLENIPRILPAHLAVKLNAKKWTVPKVFAWLAAMGGVNEFELLRTLNCGIGGVLVVKQEDVETVLSSLKPDGGMIIGEVIACKDAEKQVIVENFAEVMEKDMRLFVPDLIQRQIVNKKRVGVLISGSGTNLQALIDATSDTSQNIGAEIVLVISNKDNVEGLKRASRAGIQTKVISHKNHASREDYDRKLDEELKLAGVELVCLAGFMRILSAEFTNKWRGRLINIHPALLPSFRGTHAQRQAIEAKVKISGCTAHFVDADVDTGAIIAQEAVPVEVDDTEESLTEKIKVAEHKVFPRALQLVATGKVRLGDDNKVVWLV